MDDTSDSRECHDEIMLTINIFVTLLQGVSRSNDNSYPYQFTLFKKSDGWAMWAVFGEASYEYFPIFPKLRMFP